MIEVLRRFCSGFASRDVETVFGLCAPVDLVVVTSEDTVLRGAAEFRAFLDRYAEGPTTYWDRHDVSIEGSIAWLLAMGSETAASEKRVVKHPYRMTMVLERHEGRWVLK